MAIDGPPSPPISSSDGEASGSAPPFGLEAEVVEGWSRIDVGWVFVYDDGRVLIHSDTNANDAGVIVQRLSVHGVDLVRSGELRAQSFLGDLEAIPGSAWAERASSPYRGHHRAVCLSPGSGRVPGTALGSVSGTGDRLPMEVRGLLSGTARRFADGPIVEGFTPDSGGPTECWVLTNEKANRLWDHTRTPEGSPSPDGVFSGLLSQGARGSLVDSDGTELDLTAHAVLPHGGFVLWGG